MSQHSVEVLNIDGVAPAVVEVHLEREPTVVEVVAPGQRGPRGFPGPAGEVPDIPDLTLIFENGLI